MISRKIPKKGNSSFSRLAQYITNSQGNDRRVDHVRITNCLNSDLDSFDWALKEIEITQSKNTRAKSDNTYHLVISFSSEDSEKLTLDILKEAEDRLCDCIGFKDHQRISAIHKDTDNIHIHVAINKIHPVTFNIHEPYRDYQKRSKVCSEFEKEFNLKKTNHNARSRSKTNIEDLTHIQSLESWIKKECMSNLIATKSWDDFHKILSENGLEIKKRGNGFVIGDGKSFVRASSIHRDLSKKSLENKLGLFVEFDGLKIKPKKQYTHRPANYSKKSDDLFSRFKQEQEKIKIDRSLFFMEMKKKREAEILAAKKSASDKRAVIKVSTKGLSRRLALSLLSNDLKNNIKKINEKHSQRRKDFFENNKRKSWADWLVDEAKINPDALEVLRYRQKIKKTTSGITGDSGNDVFFKGSNHVTKQGTVVFDNGRVRDLGGKIELNKASEEQLLKSLVLAKERFGGKLKIDGDNKFKQNVVKISAKYQLDIVFEDKAMEKHRKSIFEKVRIENERNKKQSARTESAIREAFGRIQFGDGINKQERGLGRLPLTELHTRVVSRGRTGAGAGAGAGAGRTIYPKSSISGITSPIPPYARNRLHSLSQLLMVHSPRGSKVLLQNDVSNHMVEKRQHEYSSVRWSGYGVKEEIAATKYILEREEKRTNGFDILEHVLYNKGSFNVNESLVFQGLRNINDVDLVLIKRNQTVFVKPITTEEKVKLRTIKLGSFIGLKENGQIQIKSQNRSRGLK